MEAADADRRWREVRFRDPDEPYLFMAGLRKLMGDDAPTRASVIPSPDGPTVLIDGSCLEHETVRWLLHMLQGTVQEHSQ
jgi:hypothetical protein